MNNISKILMFSAIGCFIVTLVYIFLATMFGQDFSYLFDKYLLIIPSFTGFALLFIHALVISYRVSLNLKSILKKEKLHHCDGVVEHSHGSSGELCSESILKKEKCHNCDGVVEHGHGPSGEFCSEQCWKLYRYCLSFDIGW